MRIEQYGVTMEIPDDDRRVAIIHAALFGAPLPAPLAVPFPAPKPAVPREALRWWAALSPLQRRELVALAARDHAPAELEAHLGVTQRALAGQHNALARRCSAHGVAVRIRARGRGRAGRRYGLDAASAELVRALAEHVNPA